ncbi:MAG: putative transcriptional regulator [Halonotius sp. J07HN4]|nr:MAG: putative transcriptional regulator [Halonotius sp. J07HN4]
MQPDSSRASTADEEPIGEILSLLADDYVQSILAALRAAPKPATEIADDCNMSTVTVYRRLDRLETAGLVTATTQIAADGNHRATYRARQVSVDLSLTEDGLTGEVTVSADEMSSGGRYGHRAVATVGDD